MSQAAAKAPPPDDAAPSARADSALDRNIDALLDEIGDASEAVQEMLTDAEAAPPVSPAPPELEASIDEAIADAQRTLGEPEREEDAPAPAAPASVANLDDLLANSADRRMAEAEAAAAQAPIAPIPVLEDTPLPEAAVAAPDAPSADEGVVVPVVVSAPPEPLDANVEVDARPTSTIGPVAGTIGASRSMMAVRMFAWPMSMLPVELRDLIGWLALVTLFNAACVWLFLLI